MSFWKNKKVIVTGGAGFIGSHMVEMLVELDAKVTVVDNSDSAINQNLNAVIDRIQLKKADLYSFDDCLTMTKGQDIVMNLAAKVAGIEYNQKHPAEMFFDNVRLNANVLEASRLNNIQQVLVVSSACVYPRECAIPTPESEGLRYVPEPTNEGYGWAKRMTEAQAQSYANNFNMNIAIARPYNCYGPRDNFNPEKSHVIPALIKRIFDGNDPLIVWGSGLQSRAFLYVEDFARGLIEITEKYSKADPVNIGTDEEVSVADLVEIIVKLAGKQPKIVFDSSKPSGQPRRNCDNTKAKSKFGFEAKISLHDGLKRTIDWYKSSYLGSK